MSKSFYSKLAGVSRKNEDGRGRQEVIEEDLYEGLDLYLQREPENLHDPNAIAVYASTYGDQVGYLNGNVAAELAPLMDRGQLVTCEVSEITGDSGQTRGVNVQLTVYTLDETREMIEAAKAEKLAKEAAKPSPAEWTETASTASSSNQGASVPNERKQTSPGQSETIPASSTNGKPNLKQRWGSLPKKTRTWIIVIVVILILYLFGLVQPAP